MAITNATTGSTGGSRRVDVTDLRAESVAKYARHQPGADLHLERRGGRTYLVATGR
ncbi:MAG: hypothetical protein ABEJ30_07125 [Halorientalis sp.]